MKTLSVFFLIFVALLLIGGCAAPQQPVVAPTTSNEVAEVDNLGNELSGLDTQDADLDTSDLDGLEDDFNVDF